MPAFPASTIGHGGNQRSAQIAEFLATVHAVSAILSPQGKRSLPSRRVMWAAVGLTWRFPRHAGGLLRKLVRKLDLESDAVIATEQYYWSVPAFLRYLAEYRTIVFPHNIEAVVPGQARQLHASQGQDFAMECRLLSAAECCVCISEEDAALIRPSVKSLLTLPYYPAKERLKQLLEVRAQRRAARVKDIVLVLGSASNPPTRLGMDTLLASLNGSLLKRMHGLRVVVAGYGSECFRHYERDGVTVEGAVNESRLLELQKNAHCQVINHVKTSGSLTRVMEAVCCGIPIVGNVHASRGYRNVDGLTCVGSADEIWRYACELPRGEMPSIPQRPQAEEDHLREFILSRFFAGDRNGVTL